MVEDRGEKEKKLKRLTSSIGKPLPDVEVKIVDEEGNKVGPGVVGQLVIRGATVMKGYWHDEARTEQAPPQLVPGPVVNPVFLGEMLDFDHCHYRTSTNSRLVFLKNNPPATKIASDTAAKIARILRSGIRMRRRQSRYPITTCAMGLQRTRNSNL